MADDTSWDDEFPERDAWQAHHDGPGFGLDAFDVFLPTDDPVDQGSLTFDDDDDDDDSVEVLVFTVTNPPGTVCATVFIDGSLQRVELSPGVTAMTESELAQEIALIVNLARDQARAAQHAIVVEGMRELGHDPVATGGYLEHDLGLPSPETVLAETAQIFATRYASDHD